MARTSRKTINKPQTAVAQNMFKTTIYTRLSIEDKKTQGNSIDGQISIAKSFIQEQSDLQITDIFVDNGYSINQIAKNLNFAGVLPPANYFYKIGYLKSEKHATPKKWTFTTVKTILTNQVYVGDMVGAKTRKHFGEVTKRNQEEHIIVKNTHEAIISRADFAAAEKLMEETAKQYKTQLGKPSNIQKPEKIFKGILFCGHCKKPLSACIAKRTYSYSAAYRCLDCNTYTDKHIYISFKDINNAVLKIVQTHLTSIVDYETKSASIQFSDETQAYINKTKNQIKINRQLFSEIKNKLSQIYIDYSDGLINKMQFVQIKDSYYQKQKEIEKNITELENTLLIYDEKAKSSITQVAKQFAQIRTLNAESVNEIIERVEVFHNKVIQVCFKYADEFNRLEVLFNAVDKEAHNG